MVQTQVTQIPIVMIIVLAVLGLSILSGALRGFVRKISGIVAFLLAGILVTSLLPPVTSWLHTTPVYGFIKEQCEKIGGNIARNSITGAFNTAAGSESGSGAGDVSSAINAMRSDDGSGTLDRGKIKAQLHYIFPFLLCFSLLFFSQLFVRPPQTAILLFCTSFPWGWSPKN